MENDTLLYEKQDQPKRKLGNLLLLGSVVLFTVVVACVYIWFYRNSVSESPVDVPVAETLTNEEKQVIADKLTNLYESEGAPVVSLEENNSDNYGLDDVIDSSTQPALGGVLVFSGIRTGSTALQRTQIFTLDINSESSTPEVYVPEYLTSAMAEFEDPEAPEDFFMLTASDYSIKNEPDATAVHRYIAATGQVQPYAAATGANERNLQWSKEAGLLAFNRLRPETQSSGSGRVDSLQIDNWEILVMRPSSDSVVTTIEGASQPKWSPDGTKMLFLKKDGLYLYEVSTKKEQQVLGVAEGQQVNSTSMFDISNDGTLLVWTTAKLGIITVGSIISWDTFTFEELGRIQVAGTEFYWPQFSPDGKYYAVQAIQALTANDMVRQNPRFEIRAVKNRHILKVYSLEDFFFDALFTDDWVTKLP